MMADGPRQSGRTTALLLAAVALADNQMVHFVVPNTAHLRHVQELLDKHFPEAAESSDLRLVPWKDFMWAKGQRIVPIFDHTVTEALANGTLKAI